MRNQSSALPKETVLNIAIDGPAGAGKSTLARALARQLNFVYVDTGAIYRALGLYVEKQGRDCAVPGDVIALLPDIPIRIAIGADRVQRMYLGSQDVTEEIRQNRISACAARVAAIPEVREFLLGMQRALAKDHSVIMDGRDIGTVILPHADLKIFLTASPEQRAERRRLQLLRKGTDIPREQLLAEILARDEADSGREIAPLRQAEDAVLLDTSELDFAQSLAALRQIVKEKLKL